jgi:hypothetical protein
MAKPISDLLKNKRWETCIGVRFLAFISSILPKPHKRDELTSRTINKSACDQDAKIID